MSTRSSFSISRIARTALFALLPLLIFSCGKKSSSTPISNTTPQTNPPEIDPPNPEPPTTPPRNEPPASPVTGRPPYSGRDSNTGVTPIEEFREPTAPSDTSRYGKVAVVQWAPSGATPIGVTPEQAEAYKASNRQALEGYVREAAAQGAKMVITPEFSIVGYPDIPELPSEEDQFRSRDEVRPYVEPVGGPSTVHFAALAKELGVYIHFGFAEVDPRNDRFYNTVVAVNPEGRVAASYRKMSLFGLESRFLDVGTEPVVYTSAFGKIGLAICSDIYHSTPMDDYRAAGVAAIALSTSWAQWNTGIHAFQRGAQWTNAYVLVANQDYFPDSGVINPDQSRQSHIRQSGGLAFGYLPYRSAR